MTDNLTSSSDPVAATANTVNGLFSSLADNMPQMIFVTDPDGSHFYFNRRWYEYTGMSEKESAGFGFADALHPDDAARTLARWQQAWAAGANYEIEYRFKRFDGKYRWFVGRAAPVCDPVTGKVQMWIGTCTDIDDTRRAVDDLRDSQERVALATRVGRLTFWEYDGATGELSGDAMLHEMFEMVPESASLVEQYIATIHENDCDGITAEFARIVSGETNEYEAYFRVRRADRTIRYCHSRATRVVAENGTMRIIGSTQDVTEERNTLDALRESAEALRESESRLRTVVGNAPIVVFALDKNGVFTFSDGAGLTALGLTPGQIVGTSAFDLYAGRADISGYLRRALSGELVSWTAEVSGTVFETQCTPLFTDTNEPDGIIAVAFDVSEKTRASEALASREEQYRFLFDTVASGVVYQDANAVILDANAAAEDILGLTLAQMTGRDSMDSRWKAVKQDGSDFPGDEHPVPVALRTGQPVRGVLMGIFHPDEERYRWISVSAVPMFRGGEPKPYQVYAYFEDLTERREAETALRESEAQYRTLTELLQQVIWAADDTGAITYCNQYWYDYTGLMPEENHGDGWASVMHPDHHERVYTAWSHSVRTGDPYEIMIPFRRASDGRYRNFLVRGESVRGVGGAITRWIGTSVDVHDREVIANALRDEEEKFRALADNITQLAWMTDATGYITWYNRRWYDYTGTTLETMQGWGWQTVHHPDYVDAVTQKYAASMNGGESWEDTFPLRGADGEYRWFLSRAVPVRNDAGEIVRWFGTNTDITDARDAEIAIRESETRFRSLITATAQIVWTTDASGAFIAGQTAWADFTAQTEADYTGAGWMDSVHPDDRDDTRQAWQAGITAQTPIEIEHRVRRADGVYRYMEARAVPVREETGTGTFAGLGETSFTRGDRRVREWIGVHADITERKEVEFALSEYATRQARVAEILQRSLLNAPPGDSFGGVKIATYYESALDEAQVGGDFFAVFALKGGKLALVVGDVTGKGLKAAEHTGQIKYALQAFLRENPDPADALTRVNHLLADAQDLDDNFLVEDTNAMAVTVVAVLEPRTGILQCASGGSEAPVWFHAATRDCTEINTRGVVVGAYSESVYQFTEVIMEPGDVLLLATDGVTEARRSRREFFGNEGVMETVVSACTDVYSPESVSAAVVGAAKRYSATGEFSDDVCIVVLRRD